MRVVFSPAASDRGAELVKVTGTCRSCEKVNVVLLVRGHVITMSTIDCEHCGSFEGQKNGKSRSGIRWNPGTSCWSGPTVGRNYPEMARSKDLIR